MSDNSILADALETASNLGGDFSHDSIPSQDHTQQIEHQDWESELESLPPEIRGKLTPVRGKHPYFNEWPTKELTQGQILHQLLANGATGYGLRTGGGLLAIDCDGAKAAEKLDSLSSGELPTTPRFTSGKAGCCQRLYRVSKPLQRLLEKAKFTRHVIDCEGQQLDFRHERCQSVLPPSLHTETGQYSWVNSFSECEIAPAPEWLEDLLTDWALEKLSRPTVPAATPKPIPKPAPRGNSTPSRGSGNQLWGDRTAPGRIPGNEGLLLRWNALRIQSKGQTNTVFLEFSRLLKESGIDCADAIAEFQYFAPQLPGYSQYASKDSKRDLERGTWAQRIVVNWYRKDGYSGHLAKRDSDLNQVRQDAAIKRIQKAVVAGIEKGLKKVTEWIDWIQDYCFKKFGIRPHRTTLYKHAEVWHPKMLGVVNLIEDEDKTPEKRETVELREGIGTSFTDKGLGAFSYPPNPKLNLPTWLAIAATAQTPQPVAEAPRMPSETPQSAPQHLSTSETPAEAPNSTAAPQPPSEPEYIETTGDILESAGILGYQHHHRWKIFKGEYSHILWKRLKAAIAARPQGELQGVEA